MNKKRINVELDSEIGKKLSTQETHRIYELDDRYEVFSITDSHAYEAWHGDIGWEMKEVKKSELN